MPDAFARFSSIRKLDVIALDSRIGRTAASIPLIALSTSMFDVQPRASDGTGREESAAGVKAFKGERKRERYLQGETNCLPFQISGKRLTKRSGLCTGS